MTSFRSGRSALCVPCVLFLVSPPATAQQPGAAMPIAAAAVEAPPGQARREVRASATRYSSQSSAVSALARDGSAAVAWVSRRQQAGYSGVYLQRYDADGRRLDGETAAWPMPGHHQTLPSLAFAGDDLWIAWSSFGAAEGPRCYVRRVDGEGEPIAVGAVGAQRATLAACGDGILVCWVENGGEASRVWLQRFAADGSTGEAAAISPEGEQADLPVATALEGGGAVVVWATRETGGQPTGLRARRIDDLGAADGDAFALAGADGAGDIEPAVAAHDDGFAVAWMRSRPADGHDVMAAAWDREGEPLFAPRRVDQDATELSGATVAADGAGRLCVAWNSGRYSDDALDVDVHARWLDAAGEPLGEPFVVTAHTAGHQRVAEASNRRALAVGPRGELVVAWSGDGGLDDETAAHLTWLTAHGGQLAARLARAGEAAPPPAASDDAATPPPTGVWHESTLAPHDPPVFTGAVAQTRGEENPLDGTGFESITNTGWTPPDPHVAVGPDHVVAAVNMSVAFFLKDGTRTFFQNINNPGGFFNSVGSGGFVFDPRVLFDPHSGRFMLMAAEHFNSNTGYFVLAVSDDDDPNGTWYKYRFDLTGQIGTYFIDFPHIGVDERAVYISGNVFGGNTGHILYVIDKQPLLTGAAVTPKFIKNSDLTSAALGVQAGSSAAGYIVRARTSTTLRIWAITNAPGNPQLVSADVQVPSHSNPSRAPQRGTSVRLDPTDKRLASIVYRNGRIYCCHSTDNPVRVRWYEIAVGNWPASGSPTLVQTGQIRPESLVTFLPSIEADPYGNILVCSARSGTNAYVSMAYFTRTAGDPPGAMPGVQIAKASNVPYTFSTRWGDYSGASLDPRDNATFWFMHEWATNSSNWSNWVEGHRVQPPTLVPDTTTISAVSGGSVNFTLDNPPYAGRPYVMLGSASGSSPGFRLPTPPFIVNMDLNIDGFTLGLVNTINTPTFQNFAGTLDASGRATATLNLPPLPFLSGTNLWFAYTQDGNPWDFASETIQVSIN